MSNLSQFLMPIKLSRQTLVASASQTIFNLTTITIPNSDPKRVIVEISGLTQPEGSYTINSPTQVTLSESMEGGESVNFTVPTRV